MDYIRISDFGEKEVINLSDGCRYGCVTDILFRGDTGKIESIVILGRKDGFGLFDKRPEIEIPWCDIDRIGDDFIFIRCDMPQRIPPRRKGFM